MGAYFEVGLFRRVPKEKRDLALSLMQRLGVEDLAEKQIGKLSVGQQQRALIARAMMSSPELLLLDEPTVGIDTEGRNRFYEQMAGLKRDFGITVLIVSHDIAQLTEHVDEVACLARTMHWHSRSELMDEKTLNKVYACELDAYLTEHLRHIDEFHGGGGQNS